jgi:predicted phosphodiesterase
MRTAATLLAQNTDFANKVKILPLRSIAAEFKVSPNTVVAAKHLLDGEIPKHCPESTFPDFTDWLQLEGDYAVISDLHIPFHSASILEEFIKGAKTRGIKKFALLGDTFDGGMWNRKRWASVNHERRWQDDLELGSDIIKYFMESFDEGVILMGNHDFWFSTHLRGEVDFDFLMGRLLGINDNKKIRISKFEQADLFSGDRKIKLLHGANYSATNPLGVAVKYSSIFNADIIMGHQHHPCTGVSMDGEKYLVCLGGAYDSSKMSYLHVSPRTNPKQLQSYAYIVDGIIDHIIPRTLAGGCVSGG